MWYERQRSGWFRPDDTVYLQNRERETIHLEVNTMIRTEYIPREVPESLFEILKTTEDVDTLRARHR